MFVKFSMYHILLALLIVGFVNGQKELEGTYKDGELISEKCWDQDGDECECSEWGPGCD